MGAWADRQAGRQVLWCIMASTPKSPGPKSGRAAASVVAQLATPGAEPFAPGITELNLRQYVYEICWAALRVSNNAILPSLPTYLRGPLPGVGWCFLVDVVVRRHMNLQKEITVTKLPAAIRAADCDSPTIQETLGNVFWCVAPPPPSPPRNLSVPFLASWHFMQLRATSRCRARTFLPT